MTFWIAYYQYHNLLLNGSRVLVLLEATWHLSALKEQDNNVVKLKHFQITTFKWKGLQTFFFFKNKKAYILICQFNNNLSLNYIDTLISGFVGCRYIFEVFIVVGVDLGCWIICWIAYHSFYINCNEICYECPWLISNCSLFGHEPPKIALKQISV